MPPEKNSVIALEQQNVESPTSTSEQVDFSKVLLQKQEADLKFNESILNALKMNKQDIEKLKKQVQELNLIVKNHHKKTPCFSASKQECSLDLSVPVSHKHTIPAPSDVVEQLPATSMIDNAPLGSSLLYKCDASNSSPHSRSVALPVGHLSTSRNFYNPFMGGPFLFSTFSSSVTKPPALPSMVPDLTSTASGSQICMTSTALPFQPLSTPNNYRNQNQLHPTLPFSSSTLGDSVFECSSVVSQPPLSPVVNFSPVSTLLKKSMTSSDISLTTSSLVAEQSPSSSVLSSHVKQHSSSVVHDVPPVSSLQKSPVSTFDKVGGKLSFPAITPQCNALFSESHSSASSVPPDFTELQTSMPVNRISDVIDLRKSSLVRCAPQEKETRKKDRIVDRIVKQHLEVLLPESEGYESTVSKQQANSLFLEVRKLKGSIETYKNKCEELNSELKDKELYIQKQDKKNYVLVKKLLSKKMEIITRQQEQIESNSKEKQHLETNLERGGLDHKTTENVKRLKKVQKIAMDAITSLKKKHNDANEKLKQKEDLCARLEKEMEEKNKSSDVLQTKVQEQKILLEAKNKEVETFKELVNKYQIKIEDLKETENCHEKVNKYFNKLLAENCILQYPGPSDVSPTDVAKDLLQIQNQKHESTIRKYQANILSLKESIQSYRHKYEGLKSDLESKESYIQQQDKKILDLGKELCSKADIITKQRQILSGLNEKLNQNQDARFQEKVKEKLKSSDESQTKTETRKSQDHYETRAEELKKYPKRRLKNANKYCYSFNEGAFSQYTVPVFPHAYPSFMTQLINTENGKENVVNRVDRKLADLVDTDLTDSTYSESSDEDYDKNDNDRKNIFKH